MPMLSLLLLITLLLSATPTRAVLINTFDNCLPERVRLSPTHVQFHPLIVAASFSVDDPAKILRVTVWGNVTGEDTINPSKIVRRALVLEEGIYYRPRRDEGWAWWQKRQVTGRGNSSTNVAITPAGQWGQIRVNNPTIGGSVDYRTTGEIVDRAEGWGSTFASTVKTSIMVASFSVLNNSSFLCAEGHAGSATASGTCPMGVIMLSNQTDYNNITLLMKELNSFTYTTSMASSYRFATLDTTIKILAGDVPATTVGCIHVEITPLLGSANSAALTWVPVSVVALVALGTILAAMLNPWVGTMDIFRWSSNYGMDEDMIRLVTPGFADCLQWLQFYVLTGSLTLSYPGFYQPTVSKAAWSLLLFNTSFFSHEPIKQVKWRGDGIYALDAGAYGLERVAQAVGLQNINDIWVCMAAFFGAVTIGTVLVVQVWCGSRWIVKKVRGVEEEDLTQKNLPFTLGTLGTSRSGERRPA